MTAVDLAAAEAFIETHARILDRHRYALVSGDGDAERVLAALAAYRNPDGGYGWGLEPDLRALETLPQTDPEAGTLLAKLGAYVPRDGRRLDGRLPADLPRRIDEVARRRDGPGHRSTAAQRRPGLMRRQRGSMSMTSNP